MKKDADQNDRLLIDVGNTRIKVLPYNFDRAESNFNEDALWVVHHGQFLNAFAEVLESVSKPHDIWLSNVAGEASRLASNEICQKKWGVKPHFAVVERNNNGIQNDYLNLDELGVDRWMAVQGARQLSEGTLVVVNCGTAITVDVVSKENVFVGGAILPGLELAAKALSRADGIPQFNFQEYTHALGVSTADCVRVGIINACAGGVEKIVATIQRRFSESLVKVIASGGAANAVLSATELKFEYDANLVLRGLQCVANKGL